MKNAAVMWSGGKDSAYGLEKVLKRNDIEVKKLITTVSQKKDRITIHGVRNQLIEKQADRLGIKLQKIEVPENLDEQEYNQLIKNKLRQLNLQNIVYSDIFLDDVREKKETRLKELGLNGIWPLWDEDTSKLSREILETGIKARVVAVDGDRLEKQATGREYNKKFIRDYKDTIDPCAEEGRFHTFVHDSPSFSSPIKIKNGEVVEKTANGKKFYFQQLK
ncbi:MAG: diphthine--ammonia ligase [Candidatus Nanohaloarchaea archaeon]